VDKLSSTTENTKSGLLARFFIREKALNLRQELQQNIAIGFGLHPENWTI